MPAAYYNEIDPHAAQWLRNLIAAGALPPGDVDERSIEDVIPNELTGYTQCHFFAGIGGWAYALDLAGWPRDRPVWTGSCPCQPFSAAGKGNGFADERHLWPAWFHLIAQCRPAIVFGEQVSSKAAEPWIDLVHADLEGVGYAFGCIPFPAAGVGAPHIRDRNYWLGAYSLAGGVADAGCGGVQRQQHASRNPGSQGQAESEARELQRRRASDLFGGAAYGVAARDGSGALQVNGHWRDADWIGCTDGKWRPVEAGTFPLAHGVSGRVGRLRAYGNAIVPQAAAEFVMAYMDGSNQAAQQDLAA